MNKKLLILAIVATFSQVATAGDVTYVGGGRYICSGSGCAEFNAAQSSRNSLSETLDRVNMEDKERRMRELSERNAKLRSEEEARSRRESKPITTKEEAQLELQRMTKWFEDARRQSKMDAIKSKCDSDREIYPDQPVAEQCR